MALIRPAVALDPRRFGRRPLFGPQAELNVRPSALNEDLRLFAMTFAAGFLFISLLIA